MKRLPGPTPFALLGTAAALVAGYNFWSYCCGRCRLEHFFTLGPAGTILLGSILAAAALLLLLRHLRWRQERRSRCRCGTRLDSQWGYCPGCGTPAASGR